MIAKVFMQRRRNGVLNSRFYRVGGEACAQSLPKSLDAGSIISGVAQQLCDTGLRDDTAYGDFSHNRLFPILSVGMRYFRLLRRGIYSRDGYHRQYELQ